MTLDMTDEELLLHQLKNPPVMSMALNKDHLYRMMADRMKEAADRIEELQQALKDQSSVSDRLAEQLEQLVAINEAARADAKEAEAYAEELEKRVAFVEGERRKTFQALLKVTKIHDEVEAKLATCEKYRDAYAECDRIGTQAVRDLEAKLAENEARLSKAVEVLRDAVYAWDNHNKTGDMMQGHWVTDARALLAEIESSEAVTPYGLGEKT